MTGFNVLGQTESCIEWIREWFKCNGDENSKAIVGISGGIDSSTTAALCVEALGKDRVIGIMLPNGVQKDIEASQLLVKHLGIKHYTINIGGAYDALLDEMRVLAENGKEWPGNQYTTNTCFSNIWHNFWSRISHSKNNWIFCHCFYHFGSNKIWCRHTDEYIFIFDDFC